MVISMSRANLASHPVESAQIVCGICLKGKFNHDLAMNECLDVKLNSCDENADCIDTPDGYTCQCFAGFVDVSSSANLPPGR